MMEVVGSLYNNMLSERQASSGTSKGSVPRECPSELAFSLSQVRTLFYPCVSCPSSGMFRERASGTVRDVTLVLRPPSHLLPGPLHQQQK